MPTIYSLWSGIILLGVEMSKAKTTDRQHCLDKGDRCPYCRSDEIEGDSVETGDGKAVQEMSCLVCDCKWEDIYMLVRYEPYN
jgi:hypothetical protein